jgi:ribosomal-protein-alanine N-acetyltransferase
LTIRSLEARDIDAVLAIQQACPEIAQWVAWDYARVAQGEMAGWVAEEDGQIVGFLVARGIANDLEILNLAVQSGVRRRGIGTSLLSAAFEWGRSVHAQKVLLEMRISNHAALRFYERHNFRVVGRRPHYYTEPVEEALLLNAPLVPPGS